MEANVLDWTKVKQLVEVYAEPLTCFRIIPDKAVTNYNNHKFFKDIFELERTRNLQEVLSSFGSLIKDVFSGKRPEGFKIVLKAPTDYVWWEIVMKRDSINFYVLCSKSCESFVRLKLEQCFPLSTLTIVDEIETRVPEHNTLIADLKLQRHNFFSLRTDYAERAQPIEDVLMVAEDVKDGDVLKLSMRVKPYDRDYWSYKAEEWETRIKQGKIPKRTRVTKEGIWGILFALNDRLYEKLGELFRTLHEALFRTLPERGVIHSPQEVREVVEISRQTRYKMNAPVFRTTIRIASHSEDPVRRKMNLKALSNSFIDLKDSNNSLVRTRVYESPKCLQLPDLAPNTREDRGTIKYSRFKDKIWKWAYSEVSDHKITPLSWMEIDYSILCDRELGKLNMLPTSETQKRFAGRLEAIRERETSIPKVFLEGGAFIGTSVHKGKKYPIYIPTNNPDEYCLPLMVSGIQGAGKDVFAVNFAYENAMLGNSVIIPDVIDEVNRGLSDSLIACIPPEKLIVLDFSDEEYSPYLDWSEGMRGGSRFTRHRLQNELVKFFEVEEGTGVQTERYLREAVKALPNGNLVEFGMLFTSKQFRNKVIEDCIKRGDYSSADFWRIYSGEGEGRQKQIAAPVLNRFHKLIGDPTLRPIFCQKPTGKIDFEKWFTEGKVIICKIPKTAFGTTGIRTLVHWIIVKTWLTKQVMMNKNKTVTHLIINEPHQVLTKSLEETLKEVFPESRKFGLQVTMIFHDFAQMDKELLDIMIAAGSNFVFLKQKSDKAWRRFIQRVEDSGLTIEDCMDLKLHEAYIGFLVEKKEQPMVRVKLNNVPVKRGKKVYDNASHVAFCKKEYGRRVEDVEKELYELEKKFFVM